MSFVENLPSPDDIHLVIEVAESSRNKDRNEKLEIYASRNIREYWIIDVNDGCIQKFTNPKGKIYDSTKTFFPSDVITIEDIDIEVRNILPEV